MKDILAVFTDNLLLKKTSLKPYVKVATIRIPSQEFDTEEHQLIESRSTQSKLILQP